MEIISQCPIQESKFSRTCSRTAKSGMQCSIWWQSESFRHFFRKDSTQITLSTGALHQHEVSIVVRDRSCLLHPVVPFPHMQIMQTASTAKRKKRKKRMEKEWKDIIGWNPLRNKIQMNKHDVCSICTAQNTKDTKWQLAMPCGRWILLIQVCSHHLMHSEMPEMFNHRFSLIKPRQTPGCDPGSSVSRNIHRFLQLNCTLYLAKRNGGCCRVYCLPLKHLAGKFEIVLTCFYAFITRK